MRPFYVIGERAHSIDSVRRILDDGGNAIEFDVVWHHGRLEIGHGPLFPGDERKDAGEFLEELGDLARKDERLALVHVDCHFDNRRLGSRLLHLVRETLPGMNVIFSRTHPAAADEAFYEVGDQLGAREAVMVDRIDTQDPAQVADLFRRRGVFHAGFGMGNIDDGDSGVQRSVDRAVAIKLQEHRLRWVYIWTLKHAEDMRDAIRSGVDGILVYQSNVSDLVKVMGEGEFEGKISLAKRAHNPFVAQSGYTISARTLDRQNAGTDATVTFTLTGSAGKLRATIGGSGGRFESGGTDEISLYGDVGVPLSLTVQNDGGGNRPDWLLDVVQVRRTGDSTIYRASFGLWINAGASHTRPFGHTRYLLRVMTADRNSAGTDADVTFRVHGSEGKVLRRIATSKVHEQSDDTAGTDNYVDPLERGSEHVVTLVGIDVGKVTSISVALDGYDAGSRPPWLPGIIDLYKAEDPPLRFDFTGKEVDPGAGEISVSAP